MSDTAQPLSKVKLSLQGLVTLFSFSSAFPFIQMAVHNGLSPSGLSSLRYGIAALFFLPFCFSKKYLPEKKDIPLILICGLCGLALYSLLLNAGEENVSASAASLITCAAPIFAAFIGVLFCHERLNLFAWIGSFIALLGVIIVCFSHGAITAETVSAPFIVLLAAFCTGSYTVLQRPLVKRYGTLQALGYVTITASLFLLPFLPKGLQELSQSNPTAWISVMELAFLPTLIGYGCWAAFCAEIGGARAGILLYAIPPLTILLSLLLQKEIPSFGTLFGGAIVLSGMGVTRIRKKPK